MARRADEVVPPAAQADDTTEQNYLDKRALVAANDTDQKFGALLGAPAAGKAPAAGEQPTPPAPDAANVAPPASLAARAGGVVGAVAADVGRGAIEAPGAIVKGARDAFGNLFDAGDDLAQWLVEKSQGTPFAHLTGTVQIDEHGVHYLTGEKAKALREAGGQTRTSDLSPLPAQDNPTTVTGGLVKGVAQFITGMAGAGRVLTGAGAVMNSIKGAATAATAFDPHQERLSNLVEKFPALSNPVTRYLAADPNDSNAEGRFKNALEGTGLGLLTDGFVKAVKMLRNGLSASGAEAASSGEAAANAALAAPKQLHEEAFSALGDETSNRMILKPSAAQLEDVRTAAANGDQVPPVTFINFARIDSPDDVKRVMQKLSDVGSVAEDSARAGVRSFADVKLDAAHSNAWDTLMARRPGQPLSDADGLAARQLWSATTDKVAELAQTAAESPTPENLFAFRKILDVHDMVQREVLGARASTARALGAWKIPVGGNVERLRDVQGALASGGGTEVSQLLADRIATLARAGEFNGVNIAIEKGAYAKTRDAVLQAWTLGLLSNPVTHARNIASNAAFIPVNIGERAIAARISQLLDSDGGVALGEATAQWRGLISGTDDAFRYAARAARTLETGAGVNRLELPRTSALSSEALGVGSDTIPGRIADTVDAAYGLTSRGLVAEDEFFKTLGYRMELHAQAMRQATSEAAAGQIDDVGARAAELVANPPENLRLGAVDQALYQTFQEAPGKFGQWLIDGKRKFPALNLLIPFARTTVNLARATFERTPLAPLVGQWRADIAAGGARRDIALARMAAGSMVTLSVADKVMSGTITGRGPLEKGQNEALRREGWQPYSAKVGDRWVPYNIDPIGGVIGMAADAAETVLHVDQHLAEDDADTQSLVAGAAAAAGGNMLNKSYLQGFSDFIEALNDPTGSANRYLQSTATSIIPSGVGQIARIKDPYVREVYSMMDAIKSKLPGLSDSLPPKRDLWGEPIDRSSGYGKAFDAISPIRPSNPTPEPIDKEILRLGANITAPSRRTNFDGVKIDMAQYPQAYSRYVELAGNALKHPAWGMGAKDFLNAVVTGKSEMSQVYNVGGAAGDGPDGSKDVFIRHTIEDYRKRARDQVLTEFPALRKEVADRKQKALDAKVQAAGG